MFSRFDTIPECDRQTDRRTIDMELVFITNECDAR